MKFFNLNARNILFYISFLLPSAALSQTNSAANTNGSSSTAIQTAVPFLLITPDSRSGALGDAGVALSPDANANFWNPSKLAFIENNDDISASYSPWLRTLVPDVSLSYVSYAHKLDDRNSFGASLRYFNLGPIDFIDNTGQVPLGTYIPNEFSIDGSFARKFGNSFSLGLSLRYIHSSLSNGVSNPQAKAGNAIAADISLYYKNNIQEFGNDATFAFGTNISNIGSKISYSDNGTKYFLPTNLKLGVANTINLDDMNQLTLALDFNKLLVPTPPIRDPETGDIIKGKNDDVSVPAGIFGSFSDAPGGFHEELQEVSISPGLEYWYNKAFALRAGYYYQNPNKGGLHYFTVGTGFKYDIYAFDFSYIAATQQNSPLANTLRFTLMVNFGAK